MMSKHEWEDCIIINCERAGLSNKAKIGIDPSLEPDGEPVTYLLLSREDVAEIARSLDLHVYPAESRIAKAEGN